MFDTIDTLSDWEDIQLSPHSPKTNINIGESLQVIEANVLDFNNIVSSNNRRKDMINS